MVQKKDEQPKRRPRLRKESSENQLPPTGYDPQKETERLIESAITGVLDQNR